MIEASNREGIGNTSPDDPPIMVVARAQSRANAIGRYIYVYRIHSNWVMTSDVSAPPVEVAVWMIGANENEAGRQRGGDR